MAMKPGQMLTAAEAIGVLGVTSGDLADLVAAGLLRPRGPKARDARRYPIPQIEALLNSPGGIPGARPRNDLDRTPARHGGPARSAPASAGPSTLGAEPATKCPAQPLSPVPSAAPDGGSTSPGQHPWNSGDPRPRLLCALGQALTACAGPGLGCELRQDSEHQRLLIRTAGGAHLTVWVLWTSAGYRFLWNQWQSHPAADLPGAATAIAADLAPASPATSPSPGRSAPGDRTPPLTGRAASNGLGVSWPPGRPAQ